MNKKTILCLFILSQAISAFAQNITIQIKPGWNAIGIPVQISTKAINQYVTESQVETIRALIYGQWITYPNGQLSNFEPGYGYMLKAKAPFSLTFEGEPVIQPILIKGENFVCFPWQEKVVALFGRYQSKGWGIKRIGAYNGSWGPGWGTANGSKFDAFSSIELERGYTVQVTTVGDDVVVSEPEPFTNTIGMGFVYIEPGSYTMGSPADELGHESDESPQHHVTLTKGFYMQTTEITNQQFVNFLNAVNQRGPEGEPWFETKAEDSRSHIQGETGNFNVENGYESHPVNNLSWYGATAMAEWLAQKEGIAYRLPTEAEWEYAARAGSTTAFANGEISETGLGHDPKLDKIGWYYANSNSTQHPVAQKLANAWGLYDMHGNLWEWCSDWYGTYPDNSVTDPTGASSGSSRVFRGGSWSDFARYCRSADRGRSAPGFRFSSVGARFAFFGPVQQVK
jgi:formylglycine-generating enzyme required for sulfatase activity